MAYSFIAENLSLQLDGRTVINEINLKLEKASVTAICGGALSGIEHIEKLIFRLYNTENYKLRGNLSINGVKTELLGDNDMRLMRMLDIGFMPSDLSSEYSNGMSVKSFLLAPFGEKFTKNKKEVLNNAKYILKTFGIQKCDAFLKKRTASLSKEELFAVYFTASISTNPSFLLINAPADIDEKYFDEFYKNIIRICKIKSITVLFLTDDIAFANKFCERILVMKNGSFVDDTAEDVLSDEYSRLLATKEFAPLKKIEYDEDIVLSYPEFDFSLHRNEIVGIKTSDKKLLQKLLGFKKAFGGVFIGKKNVFSTPKHLRKIYHVGYDSIKAFPDNKSVRMVLDDYARLSKPKSKAGRNMIIHNALSLCSLGSSEIDRSILSLSAYDGIKLALAGAIILNAKVVCISGLEKLPSSLMQYEIMTVIRNICEEAGFSAIILSDDEKLMDTAANRIVYI